MKGRKEFCLSLVEQIQEKEQDLEFLKKTLQLIQERCPHHDAVPTGSSHKVDFFRCPECQLEFTQ